MIAQSEFRRMLLWFVNVMLTIIDSVWLKKKTANDLNPIVRNSVHVQINDRHNHYMQLSAVMIQNYNPSHIINYNACCLIWEKDIYQVLIKNYLFDTVSDWHKIQWFGHSFPQLKFQPTRSFWCCIECKFYSKPIKLLNIYNTYAVFLVSLLFSGE